MEMHDVLWGDMVIDGNTSRFDELLMHLARTPLLRRTQAIEQLTLGKNFATMPSTMYFSRWSHIWGSLMFVRKMNEGRDIDPRDNEVMQLRTLLSDVGHTAFSHLGDWMFQTGGPSEDLHDKELKDILSVTGVEDLLGKYGYSLDETVFPDVEDWVESPSPDLCVDRVDYGLREMVRWQGSFTGLGDYSKMLQAPQSLFAIVDGKLTIKDPGFAEKFAVGYSLLPTEHWSHPVHRLQLQLFQTAIRRILTESLTIESEHPREALYAVDANFDGALMTWDLMNIVDSMKSIALSQRRFFAQGRRFDLEQRFRGLTGRDVIAKYRFPDFPDPLDMETWQAKEFTVPHAPNLFIETTDTGAINPMQITLDGLRFVLPALKARSVDPHMLDEQGRQQRLSDYNPSYVPYVEGQQREMAKNYLVTMMMHPDFAKKILDKNNQSLSDWEQLVKRERSNERLAAKIAGAEGWGAATRFDHISDW
jgi:HD superfamily phosphohydrolase